MAKHHTVTWHDEGRTAQVAPNPAFPDGIHVDATKGKTPFCRIELPYPAPGCGKHLVECHRCNLRAVVTAAGRPDDPRSIRVACKAN